MKKLLIIVGIALVVLGLLVGGFALGVPHLRGPLIQGLSEALQSPVAIATVAWRPLFGVQLRDLTAQNPAGFTPRPWVLAPSVMVHVVPSALAWRRAIVVDATLTRPEVFIERLADGRVNVPASPSGRAAPSGRSAPPPSIVPRGIHLSEGKVIYLDHQVSPAGAEFRMDQVRVEVHPTLPSLAMVCQVSGTIRSPTGEAAGDLIVDGQMTPDRVTTATITVTHRALQAFSPYLRQLIGTDITAGQATATVHLRGEGDQVSAPVHLDVQGLTFPPEAMTAFGVSAQRLVELLQDASGHIQLDVAVTGRWDQLRVQWDRLMASAIQQALRSAMAHRLQQAVTQELMTLGQPAKEGEPPASLEDQLKAIGKRLKQRIKGSTPEGAPAQGASPK